MIPVHFTVVAAASIAGADRRLILVIFCMGLFSFYIDKNKD